MMWGSPSRTLGLDLTKCSELGQTCLTARSATPAKFGGTIAESERHPSQGLLLDQHVESILDKRSRKQTGEAGPIGLVDGPINSYQFHFEVTLKYLTIQRRKS